MHDDDCDCLACHQLKNGFPARSNPYESCTTEYNEFLREQDRIAREITGKEDPIITVRVTYGNGYNN